MKWVHDLLSDFNSDAVSIIRVLSVCGFVEYLALAAGEFWRTSHFQMQDFGVGMGAVIVAVGAALKLGEKGESQEPKS